MALTVRRPKPSTTTVEKMFHLQLTFYGIEMAPPPHSHYSLELINKKQSLNTLNMQPFHSHQNKSRNLWSYATSSKHVSRYLLYKLIRAQSYQLIASICNFLPWSAVTSKANNFRQIKTLLPSAALAHKLKCFSEQEPVL